MPKRRKQILRVVVLVGISGLFLPGYSTDAKPDPKKSQAAYQRGVRAEQAGKRDDAMAAYAEAIEADASNGAARRARGRDYLAAGELEKAAADLDEAVKVQPGDGQSYAA